ncbi:Rieske 2Fe-2S domain-containing protein [Natronomonas sp. CBA1123]|jgi:nitrite reductase/ring-hydroxylating ferredoxin subunit|uniref:Rieske (2Fe-2S) protein n=1 Tax=Natronomonas sp. CBA1123 TaxID=2668070 RepID=UPI0012EA1120|nr:Rieske (2Fe-2S) protein [Natronomonas sp. CBA1123]MUV86586.1 Rieske 2Fe-2S domain-containing protein [Natronomonas sp. CBA1123]
MAEERIADIEEVPEDSTLLFTVREGFDEKEVVLVRLNGDIAAWRNFCPHWTDVRLDKGSGAEFRDGEVVCTRHGATFEPDSGHCTYGPCEGSYLEEVDVEVRDGGVYLAEDHYEFDHVGPKSDRDLSSGRIGFSGN